MRTVAVLWLVVLVPLGFALAVGAALDAVYGTSAGNWALPTTAFFVLANGIAVISLKE